MERPQIRALARFYLGEPVWWSERTPIRQWLSTVLWAGAGALLLLPLVRLSWDSDNLIVVLLLSISCFFLLMIAAGALIILVLWLLFWWGITLIRRRRCQSVLRSKGWPTVYLSPRLLSFPDSLWGRLPVYDEFTATGWPSQWQGGLVSPVNLYATLALLDEMELNWRSDYDGRKLAAERISEVA